MLPIIIIISMLPSIIVMSTHFVILTNWEKICKLIKSDDRIFHLQGKTFWSPIKKFLNQKISQLSLWSLRLSHKVLLLINRPKFLSKPIESPIALKELELVTIKEQTQDRTELPLRFNFISLIIESKMNSINFTWDLKLMLPQIHACSIYLKSVWLIITIWRETMNSLLTSARFLK